MIGEIREEGKEMDWSTLIGLYPFVAKLAEEVQKTIKAYIERPDRRKNPEDIAPFLIQLEMLDVLRKAVIEAGLFAGKLANPSLREDNLAAAWKFVKDNKDMLSPWP